MKIKVIRGWTNKSGVLQLEHDLNDFLRSLDVKSKPKIIPHYCGGNHILVFVYYSGFLDV